MSVLHDPELERLLARLHDKSNEQVAAMRAFHASEHSNGCPDAG